MSTRRPQRRPVQTPTGARVEGCALRRIDRLLDGKQKRHAVAAESAPKRENRRSARALLTRDTVARSRLRRGSPLLRPSASAALDRPVQYGAKLVFTTSESARPCSPDTPPGSCAPPTASSAPTDISAPRWRRSRRAPTSRWVRDRHERLRVEGCRHAVQMLAERGMLRADTRVAEATDVLLTLAGPDIYMAFARDRNDLTSTS